MCAYEYGYRPYKGELRISLDIIVEEEFILRCLYFRISSAIAILFAFFRSM